MLSLERAGLISRKPGAPRSEKRLCQPTLAFRVQFPVHPVEERVHHIGRPVGGFQIGAPGKYMVEGRTLQLCPKKRDALQLRPIELGTLQPAGV